MRDQREGNGFRHHGQGHSQAAQYIGFDFLRVEVLVINKRQNILQ
jgi:hypothetical protein